MGLTSTKAVVEKDGRNWRVFAVNDEGERFCMIKTRDEQWANLYLEHIRYFFGVTANRSNE